MTKLLYLMRHAKSSWDDPSIPDRERPLAPRGRKAAKKLARHLERERIEPALVLCSSARRARETLDGLAGALGEAPVELEPDLYGAGAGELMARLRRVPDSVASVLLIGHNPGLHDLAVALADTTSAPLADFPTGALATLAVPSWSDLGPGAAELVGYVVPRKLE